VILNAFGNSSASKNELEKAVCMISSLGIEKTIRESASRHSNVAKKSISIYDEVPAKNELLSLLDFVVGRSL